MDRNDIPRDPEERGPEKRKQENFISTIFIVISLLIIGTVVVINTISNNEYKNNINNQNNNSQTDTDDQSKLDLNNIIDNPTPDENEGTDSGISEPISTDEPSENTASNETAADDEAEEASSGAIDLSKITLPVASKEITMAFSMGTDPVYSKTFNEYRSDHAGIDLKASLDEEVKAAYAGKVVEIRNDAKLGTTVKIDHGNNIYTEYANLSTDVKVSLNDTVKAGQVIGKVGSTALYEISDGTHLHFALLVKGVYTNPTQYIK